MRNWNRIASMYDAGMKAFFLPFGGEERVKSTFAAQAGMQEGMRVLDICCATGVLTELAGRVVKDSGRAVGIDSSLAMVRRAAARRPSASFVCGDVAALPFATESFDLVLAFLALHELGEQALAAAIAQAHRVLKPGGRLAICDYPAEPTGLSGALLKAVIRTFEPGPAGRVLRGEHVSAVGKLFDIERREVVMGGFGELTIARKAR